MLNMQTNEERYTFPKSERLRHRTLVEGLFAEGKSLYDYPLRLTWRVLSEEALAGCFRDILPSGIAPLQMMVTVPKKKRRKAVDRVRMRRRVRDAYRLPRRSLRALAESIPEIRTLSLSIVYIAQEDVSSEKIRRKIDRLLSKIEEQLRTTYLAE